MRKSVLLPITFFLRRERAHPRVCRLTPPGVEEEDAAAEKIKSGPESPEICMRADGVCGENANSEKSARAARPRMKPPVLALCFRRCALFFCSIGARAGAEITLGGRLRLDS